MEQIPIDLENIAVLKMDKELLQTSKAVMLLCSYIPPYDSSYWKNAQNGFEIEQLGQCILDPHNSFDDFHVLI